MVERITVDSNNGDVLEISFGEYVAYEGTTMSYIPWEDVPSKLNEVKQWKIWNGQLVSYDRLVELIGDYEKSIH